MSISWASLKKRNAFNEFLSHSNDKTLVLEHESQENRPDYQISFVSKEKDWLDDGRERFRPTNLCPSQTKSQMDPEKIEQIKKKTTKINTYD
jgi:hypothetical protein